MKGTSFLIVLTLFLATACSSTRLDYGSDGQYSGREWANKQTEWMKRNLQLSRDQERRIESLNWEYVQRLDRDFRSANSQFNKIQAVRRTDYEKEEELKRVLTVDQFRVYQENKKELYEFN